MGHATGADIPRAIAEFRRAGFTVREIADDLGIHVSTVYRWQAATRRPNPANFAALVELVTVRHARAVHRRTLTVAALHLQKAAEALVTDQQRAEEDVIAERLAASFAERRRRDEAEAGRRRAEAARLRDSLRVVPLQPRRSGYADADPFSVFGQRDKETAVVEEVLPL